MAPIRRRVRTILVGSVAAVLVATTAGPASAQDLTEGFDNVPLLYESWTFLNLSEPRGYGVWSQGNPAALPSHSGAENSYIAVSNTSGSGVSTINTWMMLPLMATLTPNDTLSFFTRTALVPPVTSPQFPDRLEVRMSTNGSCNPNANASGVGDFTTLLTSVNPTLAQGGYPFDLDPDHDPAQRCGDR